MDTALVGLFGVFIGITASALTTLFVQRQETKRRFTEELMRLAFDYWKQIGEWHLQKKTPKWSIQPIHEYVLSLCLLADAVERQHKLSDTETAELIKAQMRRAALISEAVNSLQD
jgi:hypothetical protein